MGRSQELSEFQRGTVIGCHLCNKSSREISSLLNIPQSTVSSIITKWKRLGTTATQPRSGRPSKVTERGQRMLKRIVQRGRRLSAQSIATELQTSCDLQISPSTFIRVTSLRNGKLTAAQIRDQINATQSSSSRPISRTIVKRRLRQSGLHGQIAARKPLLRRGNKQKRFTDGHVCFWLIKCFIKYLITMM
uniref:Sleeping Beauty transposase HTH domain-containing protein n=1 Tax=Myripristis murdjan TaxID=586833 RepID=A0A667ZQR6_9TELE